MLNNVTKILLLGCAGVISQVQPAVLPQATLESYYEYRCMFLVLHHEARGEPVKGQRLVAAVVLNRIKHKHYPNDVCSVVLQRKQFSGISKTFKEASEGSYSDFLKQGEARVARVAFDALYGVLELPRGYAEITHYHNTSVVPYWSRSLLKTGTVGRHVFYR